MLLDNREVATVNDQPRLAQAAHPRAVGAPLPRGGSRRTHSAEAEAPGRALPPPASSTDTEDHSSSIQRAVHALRSAVPFVQRLLPLLDGNFVTAVSNVLTPQPKPAPPVNLAPVHDSLIGLQLQQRELRDQVVEQNTSIKRVEDQLELVREATDRNTLEQQELMEDLKAVGNKVNLVAFVALALLLVSVLLNLFLYLHIEHVLP